MAGDLQQPNGIIGTPDGKTLYVADIAGGKTYAYDVGRDGSLSGKRLFCTMGSDGMTIDSEGNVYLTGQGVTVFDKTGTQILKIPVAEGWTGNVCFGGRIGTRCSSRPAKASTRCGCESRESAASRATLSRAGG